MVNDEGGANVEDPASFFANVFGGDRFMDYVCLLPTTFLIRSRDYDTHCTYYRSGRSR
jgi:hypothetical protein